MRQLQMLSLNSLPRESILSLIISDIVDDFYGFVLLVNAGDIVMSSAIRHWLLDERLFRNKDHSQYSTWRFIKFITKLFSITVHFIQ